MHRIFLSFALVSAAATSLDAQIIRRSVVDEPAAWASLGIGMLDMSSISDQDSKSTWIFGQGLQYRATLEKALSGGAGLGIVATFAKMPLTYRPATSVIPSPTCNPECDATANVSSLAAGFHMGGGNGVHQVIQLNVGATMFANFRDDDSGAQLAPTEMDVDLAFQVGYGIGYAIGPRLHASLVQEFGIIVHPGNGEGSSSRTVQSQSTRLSVRYGMGTKRAPRPGIRR